MKFNFRQGIQHAPLNVGTPQFLTYNTGNNTITIAIGTDLVRVSAAYQDVNYLIEEREDAIDAWGPIVWNSSWGTAPVGVFTAYLYWDINLASGIITRGITPRFPAFGDVAPVSPLLDQHWFDTTLNTMKVWDGGRWNKKARVFAGSFAGGVNVITENSLGSQVGLTYPGTQESWPDHGYILYGIDMKGIHNSDGSFVTTAIQVNTFHGSFSSPIRLELSNSTAIAAEPIPAFYAVSSNGDGTISLANGVNLTKSPVGLVFTDANPGDPVDIVTHGILFNDQWDWLDDGRTALYCLETGEVTKEVGAFQIGVILGAQTILVDIDRYGGIGGTFVLENDVDVIGTSVGAIDEGYTFLQGTTFTEFVTLVSQRTIHPVYISPSLSISSSPVTTNIEIGTILSIILSDSFTQADAGAVTASRLNKNSVLLSSSFPYTDIGVLLTNSSISYQGSVDYATGPIKLDNRGNPDPTGRILAGTVSSNVITFVGSRLAFFGNPLTVPTLSSEIRGLSASSFNTANNSGVNSSGTDLIAAPTPNFTITIPIGAVMVCFAYPATSRIVASVRYQELANSEVKGNFTETSIVVDGAGGYTGIAYRVFTYIPVEPFSLENHYKVFI